MILTSKLIVSIKAVFLKLPISYSIYLLSCNVNEADDWLTNTIIPYV